MVQIGKKPVVWLQAEVKSPPLSRHARIRAGALLRLLQDGHRLGMPESRPLPAVQERVHELRVLDGDVSWRLVYRLDADAVVIVHVFAKKTQAMAERVIKLCRGRLREYDRIRVEGEGSHGQGH